MNRRGFLGAILAAGMAPAVVRSESLMRVFARSESGLLVPTVESLYGNKLVTASVVTREALEILRNNLIFHKAVNRDYDAAFTRAPGDTIVVRRPPHFAGIA